MEDARFFRSALAARDGASLPTGCDTSCDTSLALPAEGEMAARGARVQQQVQLTLARSRKATSNGNLYIQDPTCIADSGKGLHHSRKVQSSFRLGSVGEQNLKRLTCRVEMSPTSSPDLSPNSHLSFGSLNYGTSSQGPHTLPATRDYRRYAHSEMLLSKGKQVPPHDSQKGASLHKASRGFQRSLSAKEQADCVAFLSTARGESKGCISKQSSYSASLVSAELNGLRTQTSLMQAAVKPEDQNAGARVFSGRKRGGPASELTLEKAVNQLSRGGTDMQISSASYIQHQCLISPQSRRRLSYLHGIPKLLQLLQSDSEELQRATVGALRNAVFENSDNKMEVKDNDGIQDLLRLLKSTRDIETRKQLTGLLWNLSSHDLLKDQLCREALQALTDSIIVPCSGIAEGENPKDDLLAHPDIFYNATGCLRNLSSAGPETRTAMRRCDGLIDALVHYVQGTIADHKPDDKSTENCVCILHNLSYQMDAEVPQVPPVPRLSQQHLAPPSSTVGCFGSRSNDIARIMQHQENQLPLLEEKSNPRAKEWLWSPIAVRMYLSLLARSSRRFTQEAATGALLNATAGNGMVQRAMAHTIVQKEKGLQQVSRMLKEKEPNLQRAALSLLKNVSCYSELHGEMVTQLLPELIAMLPNSGSSSEPPQEVTVLLCHILTNLSQSDSEHARAIVNHGGLGKVINIRDDGPSRACQAASILLHTMWQHSNLRAAYMKAGYRKADFINSRKSKAISSVRNGIGNGKLEN